MPRLTTSSISSREVHTQGRGVTYGALAYVLWGLFPAYWPLLVPAQPVEVLAHRIVWSFVTLAIAVAILRRWRPFLELSGKGWLIVTAAAALITVNWGTYIYAVNTQHVVESALGGMSIAQTVEGRERYPISVRYARDFREDVAAIERILVRNEDGAQVPLAQLADVRFAMGPDMVRSEAGRMVGLVSVNVSERPIVDYVADAKRAAAALASRRPAAAIDLADARKQFATMMAGQVSA